MDIQYYKGISLRQISSEPRGSVYDYSKNVERKNSLLTTKYTWHTSTQGSSKEVFHNVFVLPQFNTKREK